MHLRCVFLRNDIPSRGNRSLGIHLTGVGNVNRDAIGARVTVHIPGAPPLTKTLRAGEGFEAQGSKWLHFGIGSAEEISHVVVRWPGGEEEVFENIVPGGRYRITCGASQPVAATPPLLSWSEPLPEIPPHTPAVGGRALTASRLPLSSLSYHTFDGMEKKLGSECTETAPSYKLLGKLVCSVPRRTFRFPQRAGRARRNWVTDPSFVPRWCRWARWECSRCQRLDDAIRWCVYNWGRDD